MRVFKNPQAMPTHGNKVLPLAECLQQDEFGATLERIRLDKSREINRSSEAAPSRLRRQIPGNHRKLAVCAPKFGVAFLFRCVQHRAALYSRFKVQVEKESNLQRLDPSQDSNWNRTRQKRGAGKYCGREGDSFAFVFPPQLGAFFKTIQELGLQT